MPQNPIHFSPSACSCVFDVMIDSATGVQTLFAIYNLCPLHASIATPLSDTEFQTKRNDILVQRFQQLEDNRIQNYAQIDAYSDVVLPPADKEALRRNIDKITEDRKAEYNRLLIDQDPNIAKLLFCTNVHAVVAEENTRFSRLYARAQTQFNLTDAQMQQITWSWSGTGANRVITIDTHGVLTANQRNQAQNWCDSNIGTGRVVII